MIPRCSLDVPRYSSIFPMPDECSGRSSDERISRMARITEIALSKGTALSMPYRASIPKRRVNRGREDRPIHRDDRPLLDSALPTFICTQISPGTDKRTRGSRRVRVSPTHRRDTTATEASWISPRNFDRVIAQFRAKTRRTKCGRDIFKGTQAPRRE